MGLFDYVTFEEPLPEFPVEIVTSGRSRPQTKTFDFSYMEDYIVRDGKLYVHRKELRGTGEMEEVNLLGRHMWEREVMEVVREWDEQIHYHGDLALTCTTPDDNYVRLVARFTEGELQWIKKEDEV